MAGLLTRPGHRTFPALHQWQKFDVRFCELTAAGTVPDFHRIPFSFRKVVNLPKTISLLQNYIYYILKPNNLHSFTITHKKHSNCTFLIRAFKFTTNEDGNYHTHYP